MRGSGFKVNTTPVNLNNAQLVSMFVGSNNLIHHSCLKPAE